MASIIKGVLNHEEAVGSLGVARQPLQNSSMQASGVVLLEMYETCKGIYHHHYHGMDLPLCRMIIGHLGDVGMRVSTLVFCEGQRFHIYDLSIDTG